MLSRCRRKHVRSVIVFRWSFVGVVKALLCLRHWWINTRYILFKRSSSRSGKGSASSRKRSHSSSPSPDRGQKRSRSRSSSAGRNKKRRSRSNSSERFGFMWCNKMASFHILLYHRWLSSVEILQTCQANFTRVLKLFWNRSYLLTGLKARYLSDLVTTDGLAPYRSWHHVLTFN